MSRHLIRPQACAPLPNVDFERLKAARPRLWTDPKKTCLTCLKANESTFRWYNQSLGRCDENEIVTYECLCTDQWLMHLWFLNAGIPLNYQRLGWDDVKAVQQPIVEQIMGYAVEGARNIAAGRNLVLWSQAPGTGKTLLLALLCKALMVEGFQVHFSQFNEIIDLFTSSWRDQAERAQWDRRVRNVDILAIDDMGKEHKGRLEMVEAMVDQIVRARVSDAAPTIITTNLTPQEMQEGYGGYVMSLLSETADFIEINGADYRPRRRELTRQETNLGLARPITAG
ncbi:ATP-binding protein [Streptomyces sp. NPDC005562]|uniref:ATP-binding protein n=1 Tax=Streptomyces sp. NPDC005562 TaxID=3154890 RepID=UPI0033AB98BB